MSVPQTSATTAHRSLALARHTRIVTSLKSMASSALRCRICAVKFESRDTLAMHMLEHSFSTEDSNNSGNEAVRSKISVDVVRLDLYPDRHNMERETTSHLTTVQCQLCHMVFGDHDTLAMHTLSHANDNGGCGYKKSCKSESYSCPHCGMVFSYEDMLLLHVITHHRQINTGQASEKHPLDLTTSSPANKKLASQKPSTYHNSDILTATAYHRHLQMYRKALATAIAQPEPGATTEPATKRTRQQEDHKQSDTAKQRQPEDHRQSVMQRHQHGDREKRYNQDDSDEQERPGSRVENITMDNQQSDGQINLNRKSNMASPEQSAQFPLLSYSREGFYLCVHCNIIFLDRAMFHLHAGLHNHNSPWQCNICGKSCSSPLEFAAHVIHT